MRGVDYLLNIPNTITFQPGDSVLSFLIVPLTDLDLEGTETISINLSKDFGCGSVVFQTITIELRDNPEVLINSGADTIYVCSGGTAQLAASGALNYFWEPPLAVSDPNVANPSITPSQDIWVQVSGSIGTCTAVDSIFVKIINNPSLDIQPTGPASICLGDTIQLTAINNTGGANLSWTPKNRLSDPNSVTTTYAVSASEAECPGGTSITINVLPLPALDLFGRTICLGGSVVLNNVNPDPQAAYVWTVIPPGLPSSLSNPNIHNPAASPLSTTTYSVVATGKCTNQGTVTVTVNSATINAGANQSACPGIPVTLNASTTGTPGTISWNPGAVNGASITVTPAATSTYTAELTFPPNCVVADTVIVTVFPGLTLSAISVEPLQDTICEGSPLLLKVTAKPANVSFAWSENGALIPGATLDSVRVFPPGDERPVSTAYQVVATDANGCTALAGPVEQWVKRCFVFPNAFTPDGDGNNDDFGGMLTFGGELDVREFRMFNRWGEQVFEATGDKKTWDGQLKGKDAPSDVYVYYITVRFANGDERTFKGDVTLLR